VIEDLNPILRGWGSSFRTGNAARKFRQARGAALRNLMVKKRAATFVLPGQAVGRGLDQRVRPVPLARHRLKSGYGLALIHR
jgi:hypothetical protein